MSNKEGMVGKVVTLFLDGGWQITGEVKSFDDNKFTVEQNGDLFMVFKDKVACLLMSEGDRAVSMPVATTSRSKAAVAKAAEEGGGATFPMNSISYDESVMSIPGALLSGVPDNDDNELSVFFADGKISTSKEGEDDGLQPINKTGINFSVREDDSKDKD